jgi:hypothetical protein
MHLDNRRNLTLYATPQRFRNSDLYSVGQTPVRDDSGDLLPRDRGRAACCRSRRKKQCETEQPYNSKSMMLTNDRPRYSPYRSSDHFGVRASLRNSNAGKIFRQQAGGAVIGCVAQVHQLLRCVQTLRAFGTAAKQPKACEFKNSFERALITTLM